MNLAVLTASDSRLPDFGNLDSPTYSLRLTFQHQLEMTELPFFDEHLSLSFDDTTTMRIEQTETFSGNAKDVNDGMSQQFSADILGMPSSPTEPTTPFHSSAASNQNISSQHPASNLQLNGLDLRIDQPIKNNERELVSEEMGYASSDLERELYNVECASGDQVSCRPKSSKPFLSAYAIGLYTYSCSLA